MKNVKEYARIKYQKKSEDEKKNQMDIILEFAFQNDQEFIAEKKLRENIDDLVVKGRLKTRQEGWKIFQFYRAKMINEGWLKMRYVQG